MMIHQHNVGCISDSVMHQKVGNSKGYRKKVYDASLVHPTRANIIGDNTPMLKIQAEGEVNNFTLHFYDENDNPLYFQIEDNKDGAFQRSSTPTVMANYSLVQVGSQQGDK